AARCPDEWIGVTGQPTRSPGRRPRVALYSIGFDDVHTTVAFVRDRVLLATGGALVIALIGGLMIATRLGRRVGHLERAARSVARGRYVEPLPVTSNDEIG